MVRSATGKTAISCYLDEDVLDGVELLQQTEHLRTRTEAIQVLVREALQARARPKPARMTSNPADPWTYLDRQSLATTAADASATRSSDTAEDDA